MLSFNKGVWGVSRGRPYILLLAHVPVVIIPPQLWVLTRT